MCGIIHLLPLNSFTVWRRINFHSGAVSRSYVLLTFPLLSTICLEKTHFMLVDQLLRFVSEVVPHREQSNISYHGSELWPHTSKLPLARPIYRGPTVFTFGRTNPIITYNVVPIFQVPTCFLWRVMESTRRHTQTDRYPPSFCTAVGLFLQINLIGLLILLLLWLILRRLSHKNYMYWT